jgi:Flp pilus assembly pilin Flp
MNLSLFLTVWMQTAVAHVFARLHRSERGQATAEYALVLLGAAAVAVLVVGWAAKTDRIGNLLNSVFDTVTGKIK